jgi:glycerol-3-phosphate dehydrogenase (NAD(P)+)
VLAAIGAEKTVASPRIAILGAGNLGTTLGVVLGGGVPGIRAGKSRNVALWTIETDVAREIRERRLNTKYLPDVSLPRALVVVTDLTEALAGADVILFTVPSGVVRDVAKQVAGALAAARPAGGTVLSPPVLVSASKGLEAGTHLRMSQVIASECPAAVRERVLAVSGPSVAHELSRGMPTAVVLACPDLKLARAVRRVLQTPILRLDVSRDLPGVELGGVLKNAYALLLGLCDGLGLGLNTKATLLARALPELARLGVALGGRRATLYGLAGLGDLVGTGLSDFSRNRRMGEELARRRSRDDGSAAAPDAAREGALASIPGVVEGIGAVRLARGLAARHRLRLPLLDGIAAVLENGADPMKTVVQLVG